MKAVAWHGKRDVRVDDLPDPRIEEPTDAIVRVTTTAICGSDLHLYAVVGPLLDEGDILGHEPMGIVEEVGSGVRSLAPGDRAVVPFNISCGSCWMCGQGLQSQCEVTQNREHDKGASLFGYTKLRPGPGRPRPSSCACRRSITADQGPWGPAGRALRLPVGGPPDRVAGGGVRRRAGRRERRRAGPRADRRHVRADRRAPTARV